MCFMDQENDKIQLIDNTHSLFDRRSPCSMLKTIEYILKNNQIQAKINVVVLWPIDSSRE